MNHKPYGPYEQIVKRPLDLLCALVALIVLSPLFIVLMIVGAIAMKGSPFFVQLRPGKKDRNNKEKIFRLIKFRSMSNAKDREGNLLPDDKRLNLYGRLLRATSLDELPELLNIIIGDMSIVGPRPLVPEYLPYYTQEERRRHDVRPGLTGLAQVNGRSYLSWEEIFEYDIRYIKNITFCGDIKIILSTVLKVLKRDGTADATAFSSDENGNLFVIVDGTKRAVHRELNVERKELLLKK